MITISKPMIAASAVIAMVLVAGMDMVGPTLAKSRDAAPAAKVSERFPAGSESMAEIDGTLIKVRGRSKAQTHQQRPAANGCSHEHWPYIADECLVSDDAAPHKPARTIAIERRIAAPEAPARAAAAAASPSRFAAVASRLASR